MWLAWIVRAAIATLAVAASFIDIRTRRVPDWLTLPPVALGLAAFAWRLHWTGVALWAAGVGGMAALLAVPWLLGGFGGGDFKMALALGALGGPVFAVQALALGFAAGLLLFAGWGIAGAVRGWGDARRAEGRAQGEAVAEQGRGAVARSQRPRRLRAALAAGWRVVHDAPPPFAVALGAGAVGVLALLVRPGV